MAQPTIQSGSIAQTAGVFASTSPFGKTLNVTVGAGTNRTLFALISHTQSSGSSTPPFTSVTYGGTSGSGGTALTFYGTYSTGSNNQVSVYVLDDPTVGTAELFVGVGSWYGQAAGITAFVAHGLKTGDRYSALTTNRISNATTPFSVSFTSTSDDVAVLGAITNKSDIAVGAGQTAFAASSAVDPSGAWVTNQWFIHSYKAGASSSMSVTWASGTTQGALVGFVLKGTPSALAWTGSIGDQTNTAGSAITALATSSYVSGGTTPYTYSATGLPTGLSINSSTGSITGTPSAAGSYTTTVSITDSAGSPATVSSNAFSWTINAPAATATTLSGPTGGQVGAASANFTAGANGTITGTVTITPSDGGAGGTFNPTTVDISAGAPTATFTYTPNSAGAKTISISDNGGLTDAASLTYTASTTAGSLTISSIKNGSGTLLTSTTLPNVVVIQRSNRALLLALTSQTTSGGGALTISNGALGAGTACIVVAFSDDGTATGAWPATVA